MTLATDTAFPENGIATPDIAGRASIAGLAYRTIQDRIISEQIENLTVNKLRAGTLTADIILGSSIATASSGKRVVIDELGVRLYDDTEAIVVNLDASTGTGTFKGTIHATAGDISGDLTVAGSIGVPNLTFGVWRLEVSGKNTLISDSFTRTSTTTIGTMDAGPGWNAPVAGTWGTDGSNAYSVTNANADQVTFTSTDLATGDLNLEVRMKGVILSGATYNVPQLLVRKKDANNFLAYDILGGNLRVQQTLASVYTSQSYPVSNIADDTYFVLRVELRYNADTAEQTETVFVNGVQYAYRVLTNAERDKFLTDATATGFGFVIAKAGAPATQARYDRMIFTNRYPLRLWDGATTSLSLDGTGFLRVHGFHSDSIIQTAATGNRIAIFGDGSAGIIKCYTGDSAEQAGGEASLLNVQVGSGATRQWRILIQSPQLSAGASQASVQVRSPSVDGTIPGQASIGTLGGTTQFVRALTGLDGNGDVLQLNSGTGNARLVGPGLVYENGDIAASGDIVAGGVADVNFTWATAFPSAGGVPEVTHFLSGTAGTEPYDITCFVKTKTRTGCTIRVRNNGANTITTDVVVIPIIV